MKINYVRTKDNPTVIVEHTVDTFESTHNTLDPGFYNPTIITSMFSPPYVAYTPVKTHDSLVKFKSGIINEIIKKVDNFCNDEVIKKYSDLEIAHKLGMILYGPPGTGKTSTVFLIIDELIKSKNAVCFDFTGKKPYEISFVVEKFRKHQNNVVICFVDEIDDSIDRYEESWLTLLDGTSSIQNCIIIGCTNHLEEIPDRIIKRPSRIKYLYEITAFPIEVYKQYISEKVKNISQEELAKLAFLCEENCFTLDQAKHLIIDCYIEGMTIDNSIKNIKQYS
jgi:hypothetical protein